MKLDVLLFGGGVAGLWTLHELRAAGYHAALLESRALGSGQSIQAQGIIHGGGKYGLRSVADLASMRAIREMPDRWRDHLEGRRKPDLSAARLLSPHCDLWIPRGGLGRRLAALAFFPLVRHGQMLHSSPRPLARGQWPAALRDSALRVERMAEPVLDTASVLEALAEQLRPWIGHYDPAALAIESPQPPFRLRLGDTQLNARMLVLCAGRGNRGLLQSLGRERPAMQERPLRMIVARGPLPRLFAHCVDGGRTRLTVTSAELGDERHIWQLGGEIAERHLDSTPEQHFAAARAELRSTLPGLALSGIEVARYAATRAESATRDGRRPSGVDVCEAGPELLATWPTKFALAPLLAEEILARVRDRLGAPIGGEADALALPSPKVAAYPWQEELTWQAID